jgi:FkbM family methyltransferase
MNWKKYIKKVLTKLVPQGKFKEVIKLYFYNISYLGKYRFQISNDMIYSTKLPGIDIKSKQALYNIAPDFDYYEHFYRVKEGDIVIDAGANFGHLTTYYSKKTGITGHVYAFEPDSINRRFITENISLNMDCPDNISVLDLLIWNKNEMINFCESGSVSSSALYVDDHSKVIMKQATMLDEWLKSQKINGIDFIKMDIEGAEIQAMQGAINILKTNKPNMAIASYHMINGEPTYLWLEEFFRGLEYPFKTMKFRYNEIITFAGPSVAKHI